MDFQTYLTQRVHNKSRLSPLSVSAHQQTWDIFRGWYTAAYGEQPDPRLLTNYDFTQFRHWCLDVKRYKASTWNLRRSGLVLLCEWLGDPSLMDGVEGMKSTGNAIKWMNENQFHRFAAELERLPKRAVTPCEYERAVRNQALCALMLFAGLRVHEVMALHKSDVTINERSGSVLVRKGKGEKERTVSLGLEARKLITTWHSNRPDGPLFDISIDHAKRIPGEIGRAAGIPDISAHDLRHTFSKRVLPMLQEKGLPISVLQRLLGHVRLETTMRYIEPSPAELADVVENL